VLEPIATRITGRVLSSFVIGRVRAIETGRSVLRASNGGVSAAIDRHGRVIARTTQPGPLDVSADFSQEQTPYLRFGNAPLWLLLAMLAAIGLSRQSWE